MNERDIGRELKRRKGERERYGDIERRMRELLQDALVGGERGLL